MDDLFAPPGQDWQPVSPALARLRHMMLAVTAAVLVVALVVVGLLLGWPTSLWLVPVMLVLPASAWGWWPASSPR